MTNFIVDLNRIKKISSQGIIRTAIFMGLGVNAARDKSLINYKLPDIRHLRLSPENVTEKQLANFKNNFGKWIISNGLRELIESFGVFLDRIFQSALWFTISKGMIEQSTAKKNFNAFERKGVEGKLELLRTHFGISTNKEKYFSTINQAQNCITHRRSQVGIKDLRGNKTLKLVWWAFDVVAKLADGREISMMPPIPKEGVHIEPGGMILLKIKDRNREYKLGDIIEFTPVELNEICLLFRLSTDDIVNSTIDYAKKINIKDAGPSSHDGRTK